MTEAEWLAATDPGPMLEFIGSAASERKRRLVSCGCCRPIWHLITDGRSRRAIEGAERWADGESTADELRDAFEGAAKRVLATPGFRASGLEFPDQRAVDNALQRAVDACA